MNHSFIWSTVIEVYTPGWNESEIIGELRALPTGWYIAYDPETKRDYYFNTYTNVSQWHFPSESQSGSQKQAETNQLEAALKNVRVTLSSESLHKSTTATSPTSTESDQIKKEINRRKAKNEFK